MLSLRNDVLTLQMEDDGTEVVIEDRVRQTRWFLDETTRLVYRDADQGKYQGFDAVGAQGHMIGTGKAQLVGANTIAVDYKTPCGHLTLRWVMEGDRLRVFAEADVENCVRGLNLPGTFRPDGKSSFLTAIPNGQGFLHTGKGPAFRNTYFGMGTAGFAMAMFGQISSNGGLLTVTETDTDTLLHWEKTDKGELRVMWWQIPSFGELTYTREVVFFPTDPNVTALCKHYRNYEIEHGRFRSWDEKIAERPKLESLFGSAMVFVGYWHDKELDYAASFRKLKAAGIDKAFVYPMYHYFVNYEEVERRNPEGREIDIRHLTPLLNELGYSGASFIYTQDGPAESGDDPLKNLRFDRSGKPFIYWEMHGLEWFNWSLEKRLALTNQILDDEHIGLDGVHFDTLTARPFIEDYHPGHRTDTKEDWVNRQKMLDHAAGKGMIVSSEGFWGRMTSHYDLGSTKYAHTLGREEYCIVPMTMLVYHDSAYHTWWEVDNYNNSEHRTQYNRGFLPRFQWGGGAPRIQSAMDALMGTPPDIFPFGVQWNFIPHSKELYTYHIRIEDQGVQDAIQYVKPVMELNAAVGKLQMVEHRLHTPEGAVQETVFADGTRVVANFANVPMEAPGAGLLSAESWKTIR